MKIINLTQHQATSEQLNAGVFSGTQIAEIASLTNFVGMPTLTELKDRAIKITSALVTLVDTWEFTNEEYMVHDHEGGMPLTDTMRHFYSIARVKKVMVGGAPWFMEHLCGELREAGFTPVFAFSERESEDQPQPDGSTKKVAVFRHLGFVGE